MNALRLILVLTPFLLGGWLAFDGSRALIVGDYVTASSGASAGRLGPWSRVVSSVGLDPRGTAVKCAHLFLGVSWLLGLVTFLARPALGWWVLLGSAIATLWYLPVGTLLSVVVIAFLLTPSIRNPRRAAPRRPA